MPTPERKITEFTRTDIVDALLLDKEQPFHGKLDLIPFLKRVWPLESMPSEDSRFKNAEGDIWQHMVNNFDYDESTLLYQRLRINEVPDRQFGRFIEACMHPVVARDPKRIEALAAMFNGYLKHDGFVAQPSGQISGRTIYKVVSITGAEIGEAYEIVLSFAGEDRDYVEKVADILKTNDVSIFYDNFEEATLWGKNLTEHLHKVYSSSARYCVMFISKHYAEKVWPTHERRSAFEKAIESKEEYILPARFDDTEIPGLHKHIGYVDLRKKTPKELAKLIMQKLGRVNAEALLTDEQAELTDEDIPF
jgi:AbiJ N-terminal domain 3/TIR domain